MEGPEGIPEETALKARGHRKPWEVEEGNYIVIYVL